MVLFVVQLDRGLSVGHATERECLIRRSVPSTRRVGRVENCTPVIIAVPAHQIEPEYQYLTGLTKRVEVLIVSVHIPILRVVGTGPAAKPPSTL